MPQSIEMHERKQLAKSPGLYQCFKKLSTSLKVVILVFIIWVIQAAPKWTVVIIGDGETSAKIMRFFYTPRSDLDQ